MIRPLKDGVFGFILVRFFEEMGSEAPIQAERLDTVSHTESTYRLTFPSGRVSDYKVTFISPVDLAIESVEEFNQVI